jgi:hypothetical protein
MTRRATLILVVAVTLQSGTRAAHAQAARRSARDTTPPSRLDSLDVHLDSLLLAAPFRTSRRPPAVPFQLAPEVHVTAAPPPDPLSALRLVGVVIAQTSVAILDGVPGLAGARVFAVGDTARGIRLERVTARGATVRANGSIRLLTLTPP